VYPALASAWGGVVRSWIGALALTVGCAGPDEPPPTTEDPSAAAIEAYDPLPLVDPFIGSGGHGAQIANVNPGASAPFGMTLVGPDTRVVGGAPLFYHCAGYWWHDTHIWGFSHTHAHGMGVPDYGTVAFMPRDGWDDSYRTAAGRMAPFDHAEEWASPGRYGVVLQDTGTTVEIVATTRGAHSRITWEEGDQPVIVFDLGHALTGNEVREAWLALDTDTARLEGFQRMAGSYSERFGGVQTWFAMDLDPAPDGGGVWAGDVVTERGTAVEGADAGMWLSFPPGTTTVDLRVAISTVDAAGARANLEAELPDTNQDARLAEVEEAWRDHLSVVRVRGGTEDERAIFHTALYHASLMPSRHDDVDGRYRGFDDEIHTSDHPYYSDLSLWDTFRTLHPWYILVWPDVQQDVLRSLLRMTADGGSLPRWPLAHGYTGGMVGTPASQLFAETWLKGLRDFDVDAAFDAAWSQSSEPHPRAGRSGLGRYLEDGYVAVEDAGGSVSLTLEYAWNDHALALLGEELGRPETADLFTRSQGWDAHWKEDVGFLTGRCADPGTEACVEDGEDDGFVWDDGLYGPTLWEGHFVEGNAWHYLWGVPQDVERMIEVQHGGDRDAWAARYESYWEDGVFVEPDDFVSDDYYWHGNEPVMHYAFLGSLAGLPDLTADPARWILAHRYANDPVGLDGNDDSGTLSAWYLWAAIGWFPVAGTPDYAVASPLFERVEIDRADGTTWVVRAPGASDEVRYVRGLTLDGEPATSSVVDHATLTAGEVVFDLGKQPGGWLP
jgi:predicted alpha-1,2-mannosidase